MSSEDFLARIAAVRSQLDLAAAQLEHSRAALQLVKDNMNVMIVALARLETHSSKGNTAEHLESVVAAQKRWIANVVKAFDECPHLLLKALNDEKVLMRAIEDEIPPMELDAKPAL